MIGQLGRVVRHSTNHSTDIDFNQPITDVKVNNLITVFVLNTRILELGRISGYIKYPAGYRILKLSGRISGNLLFYI